MNQFKSTQKCPLEICSQVYGRASSTLFEDHDKITRLLVNKGAFDVFDREIDSLWDFCGCKDTFIYLQQNMYPSYYNWDILDRLKVAQSLNGSQGESIETMRMAISQGTIDEEAAACVDERGNTFLHCAAWGFGREFIRQYDAMYENGTATNLILDSWLVLARELITAGAPLHSVNDWRLTPLRIVIYSVLQKPGHTNDLCMTVNHLINLWISCLGEAGVDLRQYGETERQLQLTNSVTTTFDYRLPQRVDEIPFRWEEIRLIGFSYGPRPECWHFWFSEPTDPFAGEFWEMFERTSLDVSIRAENAASLAIPGSWVEQ